MLIETFFENILNCHYNIFKKKNLFIKMSFYLIIFLSQYCVRKCLVCIGLSLLCFLCHVMYYFVFTFIADSKNLNNSTKVQKVFKIRVSSSTCAEQLMLKTTGALINKPS